MRVSRRWVTILGALAVQALVCGYGLATFTLWAGPWMSAFKVSHGETMAAIMLTHIVGGLFSPIAGHLTDRIPIPWLMLGGSVLFCGGLWLVSMAGAMWQVSALYALPIALGMVVSGPMIGQTLAVRLFHPQPGLAIGVVTLGLALGGLTMPPIAARLLAAFDWRASVAMFAAAIAAVTLPLIALTVRDPSRVGTAPLQDSPSHKSGETLAAGEAPTPVAAILSDRTFVSATLVVTSLTVGFNAIYFNLGPWMADMGADQTSTARIISLTAIVAAMGIASFGALADRFDVRLLLGLALVLEGGGLALAAAGVGPSVLLFSVPLMGLATGGLIPLLAIILARRFGARSFARANGLSLVFTTVAVTGALLAGLGRDRMGDYPAAFRLMLVTLAPSVLGFLALGAPKPARQSVQQEQEGHVRHP